MQIILIVALVDIQFSYLLAFFDKSDIAETLSVTQTTEIVAVILGYFLKSYFETKQERKQDLEDKQAEKESDNERG